MQAEFYRLREESIPITPSAIVNSVSFLATKSKARSRRVRQSIWEKINAAREEYLFAPLSVAQQGCIDAMYYDEDDSWEFLVDVGKFLPVTGDYPFVNMRADDIDHIQSNRVVRHDYRVYLMEFAMSEGWVVERGFYDRYNETDAREAFKHARLPNRVPETCVEFLHVGGTDGVPVELLSHALALIATEEEGRDNDTGYATWASGLDDDGQEEAEEEGASHDDSDDPVDEEYEGSQRTQRPVSAVSSAAPRAETVGEDGVPLSARSGGQGPVVPPTASRTPTSYTAEYVERLQTELRDRDMKLLELTKNTRSCARQAVAHGDKSEGRNKRKHCVAKSTAMEPGMHNARAFRHTLLDDHPRHQFSPWVQRALEHEFHTVYAGGVQPSEGYTSWAGTCGEADLAIPALTTGLPAKMTQAQEILLHKMPDALMSLWPLDTLVEKALAMALEYESKADLQRLHLVWSNDHDRSEAFTARMQVYRSNLWTSARGYFYVLNGMPFKKAPTSRILPPPVPDPSLVKPTTVTEFMDKFKADSDSHELMTWHRGQGRKRVPFSTEAFDTGVFETLKGSLDSPLVVKAYAVAFWLFGTETPMLTGCDLKRSGPQNENTVRWYHSRVKAWARQAILERNEEEGPWYKPQHEAWAFKRRAKVLISDDGIDLGSIVANAAQE
ncbi:unnamed protein product [Closterium sp. Yama58-4]|nr:unnamed protein product [Closterium sp. Yama58-4]